MLRERASCRYSRYDTVRVFAGAVRSDRRAAQGDRRSHPDPGDGRDPQPAHRIAEGLGLRAGLRLDFDVHAFGRFGSCGRWGSGRVRSGASGRLHPLGRRGRAAGRGEIGGLITQAGYFLSGASFINLPRVWNAILPVSTIAAATLLTLGLAAIARRRFARWLGTLAKPKAPLLRLFLAAAAMLADALVVILAAAAGHATSLFLTGGPPDINEALFLNAFALTELTKVGLAAFVSPHVPSLRLTPFSDGQARYWYRRLALVVTLLGYTFLFVAPVVQSISSFAAANAVRFLVVTASFLFTLWLILANRERVKARLQRSYREGARNPQARFYQVLGHLWWLLAASFVTALFALWISSPRNGFQFMLTASLISVAAMAVGGLVVSILTKVIARGIRVSAATSERFPLLERRINSFIPKLLLVLRIIVIAVVVGVILDAWSIIDLQDFTSSTLGRRFSSGLVGALVILTIGFAIHLVFSSWWSTAEPELRVCPDGPRAHAPVSVPQCVDDRARADRSDAGALADRHQHRALAGGRRRRRPRRRFRRAEAGAGHHHRRLHPDRERAQRRRRGSARSRLGRRGEADDPLGEPAFARRNLPPDSVLVGGSGRQHDQGLLQLRRGRLGGLRRGCRTGEGRMQEAFERVRGGPEGINIIADFEMLGVETLADNAVMVRARIRTLPGKQWAVGRVYREVVKGLLTDRNIDSPFQRTAVVPPHERLPEEGLAGRWPSANRPLPKTVSRNHDGTIIPPDPKDDGGDEGDPSR